MEVTTLLHKQSWDSGLGVQGPFHQLCPHPYFAVGGGIQTRAGMSQQSHSLWPQPVTRKHIPHPTPRPLGKLTVGYEENCVSRKEMLASPSTITRTFCGTRLFAEVSQVKMRSHRLGLGPVPGVLTGRGKLKMETRRDHHPCLRSRNAKNCQATWEGGDGGGQGRTLPPRFQRKYGPVATLISGFHPPELRQYISVVQSAPPFPPQPWSSAFCYSSPENQGGFHFLPAPVRGDQRLLEPSSCRHPVMRR